MSAVTGSRTLISFRNDGFQDRCFTSWATTAKIKAYTSQSKDVCFAIPGISNILPEISLQWPHFFQFETIFICTTTTPDTWLRLTHTCLWILSHYCCNHWFSLPFLGFLEYLVCLVGLEPDDPTIKSRVLCQLSYRHISGSGGNRTLIFR